MSDNNVSPFMNSEYSADRNIVKHYHDQVALYLSKTKNVDYEKARAVISKYIRPNQGEYKDRKIRVLQKNKYGDREVKVKPVSEFFAEVQEKNYHLSPSLVAYTNSEEDESVNAIGTKLFIAQRDFYKDKKKKAIAVGDKALESANDELQNACKIFNNAQSGAMSSKGTPLTNKTGHTSLTSTCRALTSTVNMVNEQLLAGNRFYANYQLTLESMLARLMYTDMVNMERVIKQFNMQYATVEQVEAMLVKCTKFYWHNAKRFNQIMEFVRTLRPVELTAILCVMDLQGLSSSNPDVVKHLFDDFCHIPEVPEDGNDKDFVAPDNSDRYVLCVSKLPKDSSKLRLNHLNHYHLEMEAKWHDFIQVFFKADIPPTSIYEIKDMVRDVVLTSDTDSSIYTVDKVIEVYTKDINVALRLNGVLTYYIRMIAIHQHAQLSRNINISKKNLFELTMKNEYLFGAYVTTLMSKHYFATQLMLEGVLRDEIKMEIKGVHLRSSKIAAEIRQFAHKLMRDVLDAIYNHALLDAADILYHVAELERKIIRDIKDEGNWKWLTRGTIKSDEIYTKPESSVYRYHLLWNEVFADKYGLAPEPPYSAYKLNSILGNKKTVNDWLETIDDEPLRLRMTKYMEDKKDLSAFYVPAERLPVIKSLPYEMISAVDIRSIIKQNLKSVYAVLDSLGLFVANKKITRLVSDEH